MAIGLPHYITNVGLYRKGALRFPISSLTEEYKCAKARLKIILNKFHAVQEANANLKHRDIVGYVQHNKAGLGLQKRHSWQKAKELATR